jgi:hypothetical protein
MQSGRTLYIDTDTTALQRQAIQEIADRVLELHTAPSFYAGQSMLYVGTLFDHITQERTATGSHVALGRDAEFRANRIIGLDGVNPIIVKNNLAWDIPEAIKGVTSLFKYNRDPEHFSVSDTNSNEGEFEYSSLGDSQPHSQCGRLVSPSKQ